MLRSLGFLIIYIPSYSCFGEHTLRKKLQKLTRYAMLQMNLDDNSNLIMTLSRGSIIFFKRCTRLHYLLIKVSLDAGIFLSAMLSSRKQEGDQSTGIICQSSEIGQRGTTDSRSKSKDAMTRLSISQDETV